MLVFGAMPGLVGGGKCYSPHEERVSGCVYLNRGVVCEDQVAKSQLATNI